MRISRTNKLHHDLSGTGHYPRPNLTALPDVEIGPGRVSVCTLRYEHQRVYEAIALAASGSGAMIDSGEDQNVRAILEATDERMDLINKKATLEDVTANDITIARYRAVSDGVWRHGGMRLGISALNKAVTDYKQTRSVMLYHDTSEIVGSTFDARIVQAQQRGTDRILNWLEIDFFILNSIMEAKHDVSVREKLLAGLYKYMSIMVGGGYWDWDPVNEVIVIENTETDVTEFGEASFVFLGRVPGAGAPFQNDSKPSAASQLTERADTALVHNVIISRR